MGCASLVLAIFLTLLAPALVSAEEQVFDQQGRLVEIRQTQRFVPQSFGQAGRIQESLPPSRSVTYAYDGYRNPIYTAIAIQGGKGGIDFRDPSGVHLGVGGPGTLPGSVKIPRTFETGEFSLRVGGQ